jgi:hypothetical protein
MTEFSTPNDGLSTPRDFVQSGWDYFRDLGGRWINLVQTALGDIDDYEIPTISFDANFDLTVDYGSFVRPVMPEVPDLDTIDVDLPALPEPEPVVLEDIGPAPAEPDFSGLTFNPPAPPSTALPTLPSDIQPVLDDIVLPDVPTYTMPVAPTLYDLNLPEAPDIEIPEFDVERPTFDVELPDTAFNWQEVAYDSTLLTAAQANLESMIAGGTGLPAAIEQALFDRGRGRADLLARKRVAEKAEELGARGLYDASEFVAATLDKAREEARSEAAGHNRDITIEAAKWEIENVRFALTQAVGLETALLRVNSEMNQRALEAAKIAHDIQVAVFNANVTRFNLDVEMFKADAQVFRERLQAKIAEVDVYRAQIEGQKVIGDINEGLIRAYSEEVRSIHALAELYRAQVDGARAQAEINTQRLEQARLRIQGFSEEVRAYGAAQDAYRTQMEGAIGNVRYFEAVGSLYGRRVDAYRTLGDLTRTQLQAQTASIDATARTFDARARMYSAEGDIIGAEAAAHDRTAQLRLAVASARNQSALQNAQINIQQMVQRATLYVELLKAKSQVVNQLAASTMSGVNFGASYNGSLSHGYNMSVGYNYSGEAAEYTGSPPSF